MADGWIFLIAVFAFLLYGLINYLINRARYRRKLRRGEKIGLGDNPDEDLSGYDGL